MAPRAARVAVAVLIALAALGVSGPPAPAASAAVTQLRLTGHGFGHGRGMGQWGALGYAVNHSWSGTQILDRFYGGTTTVRLPTDALQRVQLSAQVGQALIVFHELGHLRIGNSGTDRRAVMVTRLDNNRFRVFSGNSCGGPWTQLPVVTAAEIGITTSAPQTEDLRTLPQLCKATGTNYYRGAFIGAHVSSTMWTVNVLGTEDMLRGVVALEISGSWAALGGGKGAVAVRAQALAARSYLRAGDTRFGSVASTCDSVCVAYTGAASRSSSSSTPTRRENANIDTGIRTTARQVRRMNATGKVARCEFSASTGGFSAGGEFPAASDAGDSYAGNPNHNWTLTLTRATVEAKFDSWYGRDLGTFLGLDVLTRNGHGAEGGRVLTARARFSTGTVNFSGPTARLILGLKSDWFSATSS